MAIIDVLTKITFVGFSNQDKVALEEAVIRIYAGSATGRSTLDKISNLYLTNIPGKFAASVGNAASNGNLDLDVSYLSGLNYIDNNGTAQAFSIDRALIHEISHAVEGKLDNHTTANYAGDNVDHVNIIMAEMGETLRISYQGVARNSLITPGANYSQGNAVDVALVGNGVITTGSGGVDTDDLLIGTNSANFLRSGRGNDYLYGAGGNDKLRGDSGNDYIDGGDGGADVVLFGGKCADYTFTNIGIGIFTLRDDRAGSPDGTDTIKNVEYAEFSDGIGLIEANGIACPGQNVSLVIDVSDSMSDDLTAVKASAGALIDAIFGTVDKPLASRLSIITYNDTSAYRTVLTFTDQPTIAGRKAAALAALNGLAVIGGGEEPLNAALLSSIQGGAGTWQRGMTDNRIVVFTDEIAADPGLRAQVIAAATAANISFPKQVQTLNQSTDQGLASLYEQVDDPYTPPSATIQIPIYGVAIGSTSAAAEELAGLSAQTGGQMISAPNSTHVARALLQLVSNQADYVGTADDDLIVANVGDNTIDGLAGNDLIIASAGNDIVVDRMGSDNIEGAVGHDRIFDAQGVNILTGGEGSDFIAGGIQYDKIDGGAGNDILRGEASDGFFGSGDKITGGSGDDVLMGGKGGDLFSFRVNDGTDIIGKFNMADVAYDLTNGYSVAVSGADFQVGIDDIRLENFFDINASNVMDHITAGADGAVFTADGLNLTLYGVDAALLSSNDFVFS